MIRWGGIYVSADDKNQKEDIHKRMVNIGNELTLDEKINIVDDLYYNNIESIDFSGGDLLLRNDNVELIKYTAKKFSREFLSISVPGTGLNRTLIKYLRDSISKIEFTLDSVEDEIDGSRPKGYVGVAKRAIRLCKEEGIDVSVSTVLKKCNSSQKTLNKIYNFLIENRVKEWEILRYYQVGRATDIYALHPDEYKLVQAIQYINKLMDEKIVNISYQHSLENKINGIVKCNAVNRSIGVLADGTVTACAWGLGYNGRPVADKFILGRVPEQKLKDILKSKKAAMWAMAKFIGNKPICQVEELMYNNYNIETKEEILI